MNSIYVNIKCVSTYFISVQLFNTLNVHLYLVAGRHIRFHHHAVGIDVLILAAEELVHLARSSGALPGRNLALFVRNQVVHTGPRKVAEQDDI